MKQRIITAIIFGAILIPVVIYGGTPVVLLAYVLAAAALFEVLKMRRLKMVSVPGIIALALLWGLMLPDGAKEWPALQFAAGSKTEIGLLAVLPFQFLHRYMWGLAFTILLKHVKQAFYLFFSLYSLYGQQIPVLILSEKPWGKSSFGLRSARIKRWKAL